MKTLNSQIKLKTELKTQVKILISALFASTLLAGCGGSSSTPINNPSTDTLLSDNNTGESNPPNQTDNNNVSDSETEPNQPAKALGASSLIKAQSNEKFAKFYQNTLKADNYQTLVTPEVMMDTEASTESSGPNSSKSASSNFSTTNLIEAGVDELDFAKQNAHHIFSTQTKDNIDTINIYAKPNTKAIASLSLEESQGFLGLFLGTDMLHTIRQISYNSSEWLEDKQVSTFKNAILTLDNINVSNPNQPSIDKQLTWEGTYNDSRKIGNRLYVLSSSQLNDPWHCVDYFVDDTMNIDMAKPAVGMCYQPDVKLSPSEIAERMPVDINGNKVNPADCFIPNDYNADSPAINNNITLITKIDLSGQQSHETTCIASSVDNFYMSQNAIYLASGNYIDNGSQSIISKFKLNPSAGSPAIEYMGTGVVEGTINWDAKSFAMNEFEDVLRIVTSKWTDNGIYNMLHTLKESDSRLELDTLATLPNKSQPKTLGKPNENIRGIRFMGDEGYVVTFEQTDPLYKIDLSNPSKPSIIGELEMPGFSTYLQRLNDTYLLGIGFSVNEKGRRNGIQTTIFDVSKDSPTISDQETILADSWIQLPIESDSRALTSLINNTTMKLAIPYKTYESSPKYRDLSKTVEYDIDLTTGTFTASTHRLLHDSSISDEFVSIDKTRGLVDSDDIYYTKGLTGLLSKFTWGVK